MFWRLQRYFPGEPRFNHQNFGFQSVSLILQALEWGAKLNQEQLHLQELGIATLSSLFINANRDPKKGDPAKPQDFFYFQRDRETEVKISATAADCFFSLAIDQTMPFWVPSAFGTAAIEKLRASRSNGAVPRPRAWFGEEIALFAPQIRGDQVFVPLGAIRDCVGIVTVEDADTGSRYAIEVPSGEPRWFVDQSFEREQPALSNLA